MTARRESELGEVPCIATLATLEWPHKAQQSGPPVIARSRSDHSGRVVGYPYLEITSGSPILWELSGGHHTW